MCTAEAFAHLDDVERPRGHWAKAGRREPRAHGLHQGQLAPVPFLHMHGHLSTHLVPRSQTAGSHGASPQGHCQAMHSW